MLVFAEVKFVASDKNSFTSNDGEYVEYHVNVLRGDGGVIELNSKADFSECEGKEGVAEIWAETKDKGFKLTLRRFVAGESIDFPEPVVE